MKKGFKPKLMTKKEWQDNRASACRGSGVGKALDEWQRSCPKTLKDQNLTALAKAFSACKTLLSALTVAEKKCGRLQQDTKAGIGEYEKKVKEYQTIVADQIKRVKETTALDFKKVFGDSALRKELIAFCEREHSEENINFLIRVSKVGPEPGYNFSKEVYNQYISRDSATQVNLPSAVQKKYIAIAARDAFDEMNLKAAYAEIWTLMKSDTFGRFQIDRTKWKRTKNLW